MLYKDSRKVVFTSHAFSRLRECQITIGEALGILREAEQYKLKDVDKQLADYTRRKYTPEVQQDIVYFRNGEYNFVAKKGNDNRSGEPIYLVLTITNLNINLKT